MNQIPDDPRIREAENNGWGPEDDGLDDAIMYLTSAVNTLNAALTLVEEAESEFASHGENVILRDEMKAICDAGNSILFVISKYKL